MPEPLSDQIISRSGEFAVLYRRLVIVVAPSGRGKTAALQEVGERTGFKRARTAKDYATILAVSKKPPEQILEIDPKVFLWFGQAPTRTGGKS